VMRTARAAVQHRERDFATHSAKPDILS